MPKDTSGPTRAEKKNRKEQKRRALLKRLPKRGTVVEIGVWRGDFSDTILKPLKPKRLILCDPWRHFADDGQDDTLTARAGQAEMDKIANDVATRFADEIAAGRVEIRREMSKDFISGLPDGSIDVAYIDGDHSYDGLRGDLEAILPKMAVNGVIACDDYHRRGWWKNGVIRALNEFLGAHSDELRLFALEGAQVAVERLEPMD